MVTFEGLLYGPNLPLAGEACTAHFSGTTLIVNSHSLVVNTADIEMKVGGFGHDNFYLNWKDSSAKGFSLKPVGRTDIKTVIQTAPQRLKSQFSQWHDRRLTIKTVWTTIISVTVFIVFAALFITWRHDDVIGWIANQVSVKNEEAIGQSVIAQMQENGDIVMEGLAIDTIKQIGDRLTEKSRYEYKWYVLLDDDVNAFALPGGFIVINSGLIQKATHANELAAVIAHEVQHVEQRHALKRAIKSIGWAAGLIIVLGDVNAATAIIFHQLGNMYFSRDIEDEADRLGYGLLFEKNINPEGLLSFFKKLQEENKSEIPEWFSSHPNTVERISTIQNMLDNQPCLACASLVYDWKKIQEDSAIKLLKE